MMLGRVANSTTTTGEEQSHGTLRVTRRPIFRCCQKASKKKSKPAATSLPPWAPALAKNRRLRNFALSCCSIRVTHVRRLRRKSSFLCRARRVLHQYFVSCVSCLDGLCLQPFDPIF